MATGTWLWPVTTMTSCAPHATMDLVLRRTTGSTGAGRSILWRPCILRDAPAAGWMAENSMLGGIRTPVGNFKIFLGVVIELGFEAVEKRWEENRYEPKTLIRTWMAIFGLKKK